MFPKKNRISAVSGTLAALLTAAIFLTPLSVTAAPPLDLSAYKGKVVYLDFWASWCQPCKASFPYMEKLKHMYGDKGFVVIAVNVDHAQPRAQAFLQAMNSDLDVVYDPKGELPAKYAVKDMPTSFLIDRTGQIRYTHNGFYPEQTPQYDAQVSELLHEN